MGHPSGTRTSTPQSAPWSHPRRSELAIHEGLLGVAGAGLRGPPTRADVPVRKRATTVLAARIPALLMEAHDLAERILELDAVHILVTRAGLERRLAPWPHARAVRLLVGELYR